MTKTTSADLGKILNRHIASSVLLSAAVLIAGCSKTADIEAIAARVTVLEGKVATLEVDVAAAKEAAIEAAVKAAAAETAANRAAAFAEETNNKVNKIFKQNCDGGC